MELIYNIITWSGLLIIFFYQRSKIGSLKTTVDAQKDILESAEKLRELFNVEDFENYIKMHKENNEMEAKRLIEEERKKLDKNYKEAIKTVVEISEENHKKFMMDIGLILFSLLLRIPSDKRMEEVSLKEYQSNDTRAFIFNIIKNSGNNYWPILPFKGKSFGEMMINTILMTPVKRDHID